MTRSLAIEAIERYFDDDGFFTDLERRVGYRTESQELAQRPELYRYLEQEMIGYLVELGFSCHIEENPDDDGGPFLIGERFMTDPDPARAIGELIRPAVVGP